MGAEQFVNVTCRGLEVGKSLKLLDFGPSTAFLEAAAPVPVGSPLEITTDNGLTIAAKVVRVQEQVAGAETPPGMRVAVELGSKAKGWWAEQVSRTDPVIPEPVRRPASAAAATPAADADAIPTEAEIETTIPSAGVPVKPPATRTQIMDVTEIAAAIEAGGQHLDEGDGTPQADLEVMPTDQVSDGEGGGGNGESEDSGSRRGRKKKRRR